MGLITNYIRETLTYIIFAGIFYIPIRFLYLKRKKKNISYSHEMLLAAFVLYMVGLLSQTIVPKWIMGRDSVTDKFFFEITTSNDNSSLNLVPFKTIWQYFLGDISNVSSIDITAISVLNISANLLLFAPIGFFVPFLWKRQCSIIRILAVGFFTTCSIEFIQYFIGRSSDIDDVILNTIGVLFGYFVFKFIRMRKLPITEYNKYQ